MRFVLIQDRDEYPISETTRWYWDTGRPIIHQSGDGFNDYLAVQVRADRDPNRQVVYQRDLRILYRDANEYYFVCVPCFYGYVNLQWTGRGADPYWLDKSNEALREHQKINGWCEFCDPVFGNGGWK